jgi:hypothetical protein
MDCYSVVVKIIRFFDFWRSGGQESQGPANDAGGGQSKAAVACSV